MPAPSPHAPWSPLVDVTFSSGTMEHMLAGRVILHADMDAFYASIEQRDRPELRGKPVIVGAVSARGVVAAASYEARRFGVRSAMPGFEARRLCPRGVFLPSDIGKYARVSEQVHDVFSEFTPLIEPIALDEAFLDITGSVGLFGGPEALARRLKARVREETRLTISVGVAPNKLVAKIACSLSKPDGLLWCPAERVETLLAPLAVSRLWGVGPVLAEKLESVGYRTLGDLGRADPSALARIVGDRAESLIALARGEDTRPVDTLGVPKSYGEENTFEHDVFDREVVANALLSHAEAVARRLRRNAVRGRTVTLKVKLGERRSDAGSRGALYPLFSRRRTLDRATSDGRVIGRIALGLWDGSGIGQPVRLLGVTVSSLEFGASAQLELFDDRRSPERGERLGRAMDAIQKKFGRGAIGPALDAPAKLQPSDRRKRGT